MAFSFNPFPGVPSEKRYITWQRSRYELAEEFTIAPIRRLLKKAGDLRISPDAAEEMRRLIGLYGTRLAEGAMNNASQEGRKTVLERDIKAAAAKVRKLEEKEPE